MNTRKFLIAGILGGIVYFFLGWLIYGMLLNDYMRSSVAGVDRGHINYVALVIGNFSMGFALSYVLNRGRRALASPRAGIKAGTIVGLLFAAGYDLITYATTNLATPAQVITNIAAFTVVSAVAGAVVGLASRPDAVATA